MSEDDYKVGRGRPPKQFQFKPGESGNRGRKKKRPEFQAEMVARIRDEQITVNGVKMTMFEVAVRSVYTNTIKRGRPVELNALFNILEKYGAIPKGEAAAEARANADRAIERIMDIFDKTTSPFDPEDRKALGKLAAEEAAFVMKCPNCSPFLRERWNLPERLSLTARLGRSGLQNDLDSFKKGEH